MSQSMDFIFAPPIKAQGFAGGGLVYNSGRGSRQGYNWTPIPGNSSSLSPPLVPRRAKPYSSTHYTSSTPERRRPSKNTSFRGMMECGIQLSPLDVNPAELFEQIYDDCLSSGSYSGLDYESGYNTPGVLTDPGKEYPNFQDFNAHGLILEDLFALPKTVEEELKMDKIQKFPRRVSSESHYMRDGSIVVGPNVAPTGSTEEGMQLHQQRRISECYPKGRSKEEEGAKMAMYSPTAATGGGQDFIQQVSTFCETSTYYWLVSKP